MIYKIKQFCYLLDTPVKKGVPFLILAYLFSSFLDVIGIGSISVFLGILARPSMLAEKFPQIHFLIGGLTEKELIFISGLGIIVAFITKAIIALFIQAKSLYFCRTFSVRLKIRLMNAYQHAPYIYHLQKNSAYLLSRIQGSVDSYIAMVLAVLTFISNGLITLSILFLLLLIHPIVTLFLIGMFAILGFGYDSFAKKKVSHFGKMTADAIGEMIKVVHHGLQGLIEIRVLNREKYFINELNMIAKEYAKSNGSLNVLQQAPRFLIENIIAIFMVALSIGGILAGYGAESIVVMIGIFAAAGVRLLPTFNQIMGTMHTLRSCNPHMQMIYEDIKELDSMNSNFRNRNLSIPDETKLNFHTLSLMNISYQYPGIDLPALKEINIDIKKGESIGLIGASGAGKSTLVNLILGFLEPTQGQLLVDGRPIENIRAWLNNFAYIPQSIFLLDDTLRRNIALGVEDEKIDEEKIWHAIHMAQLTEVVERLPHVLDTFLGENGIRLSGGQRQRVALARAFYHERDIIVMDEATSSLDNDTEEEIINTIKHLKGNKTIIVIAHRLTTVEHCDVLYKLEKGKIVSSGSFQQVIGAITS